MMGQTYYALPRDDDGNLLRYVWPGGYTVAYYTSDGDRLCYTCALGVQNSDDAPSAASVYWEGPDQYCEECNAACPSEYGDPFSDTPEA